MHEEFELTADLFERVETDLKEAEAIKRPSLTYWKDAWRRLKENKLAMFGLTLIVVLILLAIFAPILSQYSYETQSLKERNLKPSAVHWFGTDSLGRDLWTRAWYGARISLTVGFVATAIQFIIGAIYGGISGSVGGWIDSLMMRIAEIFYSIPYMLIVILMMVVLDPGLVPMIIALVATGWIGMARLVRGQVLQLKEQDYVKASEALGGGMLWKLRKHLIPNTMGPILVDLTLSVPSAIFAEATLSFLGLGISAPMASWGSMANDALTGLFTGCGYQLLFPALLISLTMFGFNVFGDGLRDALDPQLRK
ncbi:ABC transporter permease [Cellulosilyticum ruminicola]|uniref:ABC transporter permease n=1 Tax=Cellulosilyticum ruminicola TaxID=425254 RepID=UPI0006D1CE18|nr:ABC transporter permease [Cellulosilyticum ruminicola]